MPRTVWRTWARNRARILKEDDPRLTLATIVGRVGRNRRDVAERLHETLTGA